MPSACPVPVDSPPLGGPRASVGWQRPPPTSDVQHGLLKFYSHPLHFVTERMDIPLCHVSVSWGGGGSPFLKNPSFPEGWESWFRRLQPSPAPSVDPDIPRKPVCFPAPDTPLYLQSPRAVLPYKCIQISQDCHFSCFPEFVAL